MLTKEQYNRLKPQIIEYEKEQLRLFRVSGSCSADELEEMKRLAHEGLPDDCVKGWDEVKFCENRQGDGNMCKWCSNYR